MSTIEIDHQKIEVEPGQMIIEAADKAGIKIPRFCYHRKLSIAANCRMCLVEVEKAPKPLPACATPVSDGMKVFTTSPRAIDAQKAVMEFLLINHPLDCPICDQGGQCELQDVALEYGKSVSRFTERKRVVKDKNIGPLISTEMTRCIHCTRCVRFGEEIAGQREMGATGRGEHMEIGTYIEQGINSEVSGNIIDLCPVGALTSKPFRFHARAWELAAVPAISLHDCLGSHLYFHTHHNKVVRALPRACEAINEVWLSDRDRFSYEGLSHPSRLAQPQIKRQGKWEAVDWPTALQFAIDSLSAVITQNGPDQIGALVSPNSSCEEAFLLQKILRQQGCYHIDHRLRQPTTRHQAWAPSYPSLGISLSALEKQQMILIIGSALQKEQPILNLRLRKASLQGAKIATVNPLGLALNYPLAEQLVDQGCLVTNLSGLLKAVATVLGVEAPGISSTNNNYEPSPTALSLAKALVSNEANKTSIILGPYAWSHPQADLLYTLSTKLAQLLQATWGELSEGSNSAGAWLSGAVPHRLPLGVPSPTVGLSAVEMLLQPRKAYWLLGCEPEFDSAVPKQALQALQQANCVIACTAFDSPQLRDYATVLLPITPSSESSGTFVNAWGEWQTVTAAVQPLGQSRPAWKVLRVLANLWGCAGFDYQTSAEILAELQALAQQHPIYNNSYVNNVNHNSAISPTVLPGAKHLRRLAPTPLYQVDGITRRASALQQTQDALQAAEVQLNPTDALSLGIQAGQKVWVSEEGQKTTTPLTVAMNPLLPIGSALVAASIVPTQSLGAPYGVITLQPYQSA